MNADLFPIVVSLRAESSDSRKYVRNLPAKI